MEGLVVLTLLALIFGWSYLSKKSKEADHCRMMENAIKRNKEVDILLEEQDAEALRELRRKAKQHHHRSKADILADQELDYDLKVRLLIDVHGCDEESAYEHVEIANKEIERHRKSRIRREVKKKLEEKSGRRKRKTSAEDTSPVPTDSKTPENGELIMDLRAQQADNSAFANMSGRYRSIIEAIEKWLQTQDSSSSIRAIYRDKGFAFYDKTSYFLYVEPQQSKIVIAPLRLSVKAVNAIVVHGKIRDITGRQYAYGGDVRIDYADSDDPAIACEIVGLIQTSHQSQSPPKTGFIKPPKD